MEDSGITSKNKDEWHVPVLVNEVLSALACRPGMNVLDCTVGFGGLASKILEQTSPTGLLIGIDQDSEALDVTQKALKRFGNRVSLVQGNFSNLDQHLASVGSPPVDGVVFDLGVNSFQLNSEERGFSFLADGPLDMRMDRSTGETAAELIERLSERELADLIYQFGEERYARRIAKGLVNARRVRRVDRTGELVAVIRQSVPAHYRHGRIHFATRTFQAFRIAVNRELAGLETALPKAVQALCPEGRICAVSFHSLEERIVKHTFKRLAAEPYSLLQILTKRPVMATQEEIHNNPRARSAKLRAAVRRSRGDES